MIAERHVMVLLCAACTLFNYADRVNISVVILSMAEQYGWTTDEQATVMSAFYMGYLWMQVGGALLARRFGGKAVLGCGATLWSLFTVFTPFAADLGFYPLLACRFAMGLSEGVAFPAVFHFLASWVPGAERGRAVSSVLTGCHIGTVLALMLSPHVIVWYSWQTVFHLFGGSGAFWIAAWTYLAYDKETEPVRSHSSPKGVDDDDRERMLPTQLKSQQLPHSASMDSLPEQSISSTVLARFVSPSERKVVAKIFNDPGCLAVCFTQISLNLSQSIVMAWLPTYFAKVYGVDLKSLSYTAVPYISMALCCNFGGWGADYLATRGMSMTRVRKVVQGVSCCGTAFFYIMFSLAPTMVSAIFTITAAMIFSSLGTGGFEASYLDMASPALAGTFKSVGNSLGAVSSFVAMPYTSVMLRLFGGSWRCVFASLAAFQLSAGFVFGRYSTARQVLVESGDRPEAT